MSDFTPGPWFGDGREPETGDILVYAPEAKHGCRDICFIPEDDKQDVANAHLIGAAPELYEALVALLPHMPPKDALCHIGICPQDRCGNCTRIAAGHAALAKARGETA